MADLLGEVTRGVTGAGLYRILLFAIITTGTLKADDVLKGTARLETRLGGCPPRTPLRGGHPFKPVLARDRRAGGQGKVPASAGTIRTDRPMFADLLAGVILSVGALTFFPPSGSVRLPSSCLTGGSSDVRVA